MRTKLFAVRGAVSVDENTAEAIRTASVGLYRAVLEKNSFTDIVSVQISMTEDLTAAYPAKFIREDGCTAPLFSSREPSVDNALPLCIRLLITAYGSGEARHVYQGKAAALRPDIK